MILSGDTSGGARFEIWSFRQETWRGALFPCHARAFDSTLGVFDQRRLAGAAQALKEKRRPLFSLSDLEAFARAAGLTSYRKSTQATLRVHSIFHTPANYSPTKEFSNERKVQVTLIHLDVSHVGPPLLIGTQSAEIKLQQIWRRTLRDISTLRLNAQASEAPYEALSKLDTLDAVFNYRKSFTSKLLIESRTAASAFVVLKDPQNLDFRLFVSRSSRKLWKAFSLGVEHRTRDAEPSSLFFTRPIAGELHRILLF